jgi:hypothetical protein
VLRVVFPAPTLTLAWAQIYLLAQGEDLPVLLLSDAPLHFDPDESNSVEIVLLQERGRGVHT